MNYLKVLYQLIHKCQTTTPQSRLEGRNIFDPRLKSDYIYTEKHHIILRSLGGDSNSNNIIVVLPEEHIFIHQLNYKIFGSREDMLAVRFCLNGFKGQPRFRGNEFEILTKKLRQGYAWIRQESSEFRKNHGWQTENGRDRISKAMMNMVVVKDNLTGKLMGKHPKTHPKIISGEWVHHTKGLCQVINPVSGKRMFVRPEEACKFNKWSLPSKGDQNTNYSGITKDEVVVAYHTYIEQLLLSEDPAELSGVHFNNWLLKNHPTYPGFPMVLKPFRFPELKESKFKSMVFMIKIFSKDNEILLLKLLRTKSKAHRNKISNTNRNKINNKRKLLC